MSGMFGKVAAVAAAATAVVAMAGVPASAADTAYNTRSVWLDGQPSGANASACTTRSMYLASGTYTWTQIFGGSRTPTRDIYLATGTYTWRDCVVPHNGYYEQTSSLSKPGSETAYLIDPSFGQLAGTYTFGSLLDPHF
ncbi:hypothetical protein OHB39_34715 [Streptomyces sp. NBC_00047]|uniref:hypothetical protein n=1 Tax=Streptomyces sp. NBC_00047 TaxID=2975627 RepID=UPI0022505A02|nr:hypothetical protein [Streptomyces sp. NBC_00047]MCX5612666.1 hypothetical protein [Streptomyces sp. NBC_00047]